MLEFCRCIMKKLGFSMRKRIPKTNIYYGKHSFEEAKLKKQHNLSKGKAIKHIKYKKTFPTCIQCQDDMPDDEHWFVHLNIFVFIQYLAFKKLLNVTSLLFLFKPSLKMLVTFMADVDMQVQVHCGINIYGDSKLFFYFVRCSLSTRLHLQWIIKLSYNNYMYRNECMKLYLRVPIKEIWQFMKISPNKFKRFYSMMLWVLTTYKLEYR